jgi:hypothetical protein
MDARLKGDLTKWCKFLLVSVIETAKSGIETFDGILKLQQQIDVKYRLWEAGLEKPNSLCIFVSKANNTSTNVSKVIGISPATGYKLSRNWNRLGF